MGHNRFNMIQPMSTPNLHWAPTQIVASPAVAGTLTVTVFVLKPGEMAPSLALQDGCWGVDGEMDEKLTEGLRVDKDG